MIFFNILSYAVLGFMLAKWFAPAQWAKDIFFEHFEKQLNVKFPFKWAFYCSKCVTFWGTLIYTHDLQTAAISALLAYAIHFSVNKIDWYWVEKS